MPSGVLGPTNAVSECPLVDSVLVTDDMDGFQAGLSFIPVPYRLKFQSGLRIKSYTASDYMSETVIQTSFALGPFHLISNPPPDEVSKILTPNKRRSKCRHKTPLRKL
jgi:hypothetical protein